jgi:hypothetical protein
MTCPICQRKRTIESRTIRCPFKKLKDGTTQLRQVVRLLCESDRFVIQLESAIEPTSVPILVRQESITLRLMKRFYLTIGQKLSGERLRFVNEAENIESLS